MKGIIIFGLLLVGAAGAEDFTLSGDGVGPIAVHTQLTYEGKGERLIASATNNSGLPISRVDFCVAVGTRDCLFTFWSPAEWRPGVTLNWTATTTHKTIGLQHAVGIGGPPAKTDIPDVVATPKPAPPPKIAKPHPTRDAIVAALAAGIAAASQPATTIGPTGSPQALLLFGGSGHRTFLGCLNCSKYESGSVLNEYGDHGSKYASDSIFNPYGDFGSKYSESSPCNPYASDPPVIVDREGAYYGRLTVNRFADQSRNRELIAWIAGVCQR